MSNTEAIESEKFIVVNPSGAAAENREEDDTDTKLVSTPPPTPNPTDAPTSKPATSAPTKPDPLNPKWYSKTHREYQRLIDMHEETGAIIHTYDVAGMLCQKEDLWLCPYDSYCPNGKGSDPFNGGPPETHNSDTLEETQWAPFYPGGSYENVEQGAHWVQIGTLSKDDGGTENNDFIKCWTYDDWYGGHDLDITDLWEDKNRFWILCCEKEEEGESTR